MRKYLLFILLFVVLSGCKKDAQIAEDSLSGRWQFYTDGIVRIDNTGTPGPSACDYETRVSDMYLPAGEDCRRDDTYLFADDGRLTINFGTKKCTIGQITTETISYEVRGDSLLTDRFNASIVLLSKDTLIIDYCVRINLPVPGNVPPVDLNGKMGVKFIRVR